MRNLAGRFGRVVLFAGCAGVSVAACASESPSQQTEVPTAFTVEVGGVVYVLPAPPDYDLYIGMVMVEGALESCRERLEWALADNPPPAWLKLELGQCQRRVASVHVFGAPTPEGVVAVTQAFGDVCARLSDLGEGEAAPVDLLSAGTEAVTAVEQLLQWYEVLGDGVPPSQPA